MSIIYAASPSLESKQDAGNDLLSTISARLTLNLASLDAKTPSLGQALMVTSQPVVIASDQSKIDIKSQASTVTVTTSASIALSSVQIVAANPNRKGFYLWNNGANSLYITFTSPASSSTPITIIAPFTSYESKHICWTGAIWGIRNAGTGTATITELS